MLMEVKNQAKVMLLSIKYALQREMLNKVTFLSNIIFMILNNGCFIIQWIILYSLREDVGGYTFKQVLLLWGLAAGTYGVAHFFFKEAFELSGTIHNGKLDAYLIQPKNVLISIITSNVEVSAIGDMLYGIIMLVLFGFSIKNFLLFALFSITGGLMVTSVAIIWASFSFWFGRVSIVTDTVNSLITNFATYPEGIFKGITKVFFYTFIPIGFADYLPVEILTEFQLIPFLIVLAVTIVFILFTFFLFNQGLKRYSSSNLMNVRI